VESVRCRIPAPTRPSPPSRASSASSSAASIAPATSRDRNSLSTEKAGPLIVQRQAQAVLPVQPAPHRISGLPVRQVLRELQHRDHRQLRRGDPRRPPHPVRRGERLVLAPGTQLITGPHRQRPLPERPLRDPGGISRHLRPRPWLHAHDDPILRPGTGDKEDTGHNADYHPHHDRRLVHEPACHLISQQGLIRGILTPNDRSGRRVRAT
jgi:hypothetical protein